ncbi:sugar dehydrogenase complex small subunit [Bradyrhizobium canariense]|uniref:sugar dehydrogenase complex small subunit n=1 Tax=Bradyrhizobium canariense TaxID=255045 RepID=UPI0032DFAC26
MAEHASGLQDRRAPWLLTARCTHMRDRYRDDSPSAFSLARRELLVGGLLVVGIAALPAVPAVAAPTSSPDEAAARFMEISSLLVPHRLNAEVGQRMGAAMGALNLSLSQQIDELLAIAREKSARVVEDFFADVPDGPLKEAALSIISAWYLGVITDALDAEVFAYEYALMYQPTRDVMTIPSYAISGPNGWTAEAPLLSNMPEF